MTLTVDEFMRRLLMHVLPRRFHPIGHYGLFANGGGADNIARARELLGMPATDVKEGTAAPDRSKEPAQRCRSCGGPITVIETFEAGRKPSWRPPPPIRRIGIDSS